MSDGFIKLLVAALSIWLIIGAWELIDWYERRS